jgi:uncharacterized membrane protein HdeD (DUF308 family)
MTAKLMTGTWWLLLLRGIVALVFGIMALANVGATAMVLFLWFIIFTITDGIFTIVMAIANRKEQGLRGIEIFSGAVHIGIGLVAVFWPQLTALVLIYLIAARAIIGGIAEIILAFKAPPRTGREWLMAVGGVLSLIFGVLMIFQPVQLGLALLWVIGCWAIAMGLILIIAAFMGGSRTPATA